MGFNGEPQPGPARCRAPRFNHMRWVRGWAACGLQSVPTTHVPPVSVSLDRRTHTALGHRRAENILSRGHPFCANCARPTSLVCTSGLISNSNGTIQSTGTGQEPNPEPPTHQSRRKVAGPRWLGPWIISIMLISQKDEQLQRLWGVRRK